MTVEKEEASTFQSADLSITVADMFVELYCQLYKTNYCLEVLVKTLVFLLYWIHTSQNVYLSYSMQLNSNLNSTRPWMFYLQTEAVLKASLLLKYRLLHRDTVFPERIYMTVHCLGRTFMK